MLLSDFSVLIAACLCFHSTTHTSNSDNLAAPQDKYEGGVKSMAGGVLSPSKISGVGSGGASWEACGSILEVSGREASGDQNQLSQGSQCHRLPRFLGSQ